MHAYIWIDRVVLIYYTSFNWCICKLLFLSLILFIFSLIKSLFTNTTAAITTTQTTTAIIAPELELVDSVSDFVSDFVSNFVSDFVCVWLQRTLVTVILPDP